MTHNKKAPGVATPKASNTALACSNSNIAPTPNTNTQAARLLAALQTGRRINPLEAWLELGIYRVADAAYKLRKMGYPIKAESIKVPNRFNETCLVARYWLPIEGALCNTP